MVNIKITETTIKQLLLAIEYAHINYNLSENKTIRVESEYSDVAFDIDLEYPEKTQESLGYKLIKR